MNITPEKIHDISMAFQKSRVLLSAVELGVFDALEKNASTASVVAKKIGADGRATDRLLNALVAMGFVNKKNFKFSLPKVSKKYLISSSSYFMSNLLHTSNMWRRWTTLSDAVIKGRNILPKKRDAAYLKRFIGAMHYRANLHAKKVVSLIDLKNVRSVLDVGGGSGVYAMEFCRANKNISATVFDLPEVTRLTKKYLKAEKLQRRVTTMSGDLLKNCFGKKFDIIFVSSVSHILSLDENLRLAKKACAHLNPGGHFIIHDFIMNDERTLPKFGTLFALNMLVATAGGDTYTEKEVRGWMKKAGLKNVKRIQTPFNSSLMIGKK